MKQKYYPIIDADKNEVPFLRGIMIRSLQNVGVPFDQAFKIAQSIRSRIRNKKEVTTEQLRKLIERELQNENLHDALERYRIRPSVYKSIFVIDLLGQSNPFSKNLLSQSLEPIGIGIENCYKIAASIESQIREQNKLEITSTEICKLTYDLLLEEFSPIVANRYLNWINFSRNSKPLIILVGGITGSGKSTIASELLHRLNIIRSQSTDMLREIMRLMIPKELIPTLHRSTFDAWESLPNLNTNRNPQVINGYLHQTQQVSIGIEGVIRRAIREQVSIVIEGIHISPSFQNRLRRTRKAMVVPIFLGILKKKNLRKHLKGRASEVELRRSERYLDNLDKIWTLQSYLLDEADRYKITIIQNEDSMEESIQNIMHQISVRIEKEFSIDPTVFFKKVHPIHE